MDFLRRACSVAVLAASLALAPLAAAPAAAQPFSASPTPAADSDISWSVRPGDAAGPDGRAWVEWEADPGTRRTEHLVVANHGDREVQFRLSAADGYFTDTGRFNMLPSDRQSLDAGTWVALPETVSVPAGGSKVVPFEITVPADATPGDHPAGVAASIVSPGSGTVGVESRVGFRVMTRVTGELRTEMTAAIDGSFTGSVNPFQAGSLNVSYDLSNSGNTRLRTQPVIHVSGPFGWGASSYTGEEVIDMAPGESRSATLEVSSAWPLAWYELRIEAMPDAVSDEVDVADTAATTATTLVMAVPVSQVVALLAAALLVTWSVVQRRRAQRTTARLVEAARAEGRAEAPGEPGDEPRDAPRDAAPVDAPSGRALDPSAQPVRALDPSAPPRRPRDGRARALTILAVLSGAGTLAASLALGAPGASAVTSDDQPGVVVSVDISPLPPVVGPPQPSPQPPVSPSPGTPASPSPGPLSETGAGNGPALLLAAGLLLVGVAAVALGRRAWPARRALPEMRRRLRE